MRLGLGLGFSMHIFIFIDLVGHESGLCAHSDHSTAAARDPPSGPARAEYTL